MNFFSSSPGRKDTSPRKKDGPVCFLSLLPHIRPHTQIPQYASPSTTWKKHSRFQSAAPITQSSMRIWTRKVAFDLLTSTPQRENPAWSEIPRTLSLLLSWMINDDRGPSNESMKWSHKRRAKERGWWTRKSGYTLHFLGTCRPGSSIRIPLDNRPYASTLNNGNPQNTDRQQHCTGAPQTHLSWTSNRTLHWREAA